MPGVAAQPRFFYGLQLLESGIEACFDRMLAQYACAEGVDRPYEAAIDFGDSSFQTLAFRRTTAIIPTLLRSSFQLDLEPLAQLACGLTRERHGGEVFDACTTAFHECDHARDHL